LARAPADRGVNRQGIIMKRPHVRSRTFRLAVLVAACIALALPVPAIAGSSVLDLSLEELLQVKVTSPSKRAQALEDVPAAVYVLTSEDLRRSGVTSISDALRMVPGLQVARIDAGKWAISCRGFNDRFANKMLVMVDGRTVYTELFAGVFWEALDTLLEDVERIEVIRGPGASVWGANAVNGVVNIITKSAEQTQSAFVQAGGASRERRAVALRSGGKARDHGSYRFYGKYTQHDALESAGGDHMADQWHNFRAGVRYDWTGSPRSDFGLVGEYYDGRAGSNTMVPSLTAPYLVQVDSQDWSAGHSVKARWTHRASASSEATVQAYYTHLHQGYRDLMYVNSDDVDFETTHSLALGTRHSLMAGLGYRMTAIRTEGSFQVCLNPARTTSNLLNAFTQYEFRARDDRFHVIFGTKTEYKSTSGWDLQPTARALYRLRAHQTVWVSASRAVRTPSGAEQTAVFHNAVIPPDPRSPDAPATVVTSSTNSDFLSEDMVAMEVGYRGYFLSHLQIDAAAFENRYDRLRSARYGTPYFDVIDGVPYVIMPLSTHNDMKARTWGLEMLGTLQAASWCRIGVGYTRLETRSGPRRGAPRDIVMMAVGNDPDRQVSAHVNLDLSRRLHAYTAVRYVDALPDPRIPSYLVGDLTTEWTWSSHVTTVVGVRDIGSGNRREFEPLYIRSTSAAIPTSVFCYFNLRY
jgi:iron complex outermembrane recepter protein